MTMTKWEYTTFYAGFTTLKNSLEEYGKEGWELTFVVEVDNIFYAFFKRPLDPTPQDLLA